jgi:hypothetical protein
VRYFDERERDGESCTSISSCYKINLQPYKPVLMVHHRMLMETVLPQLQLQIKHHNHVLINPAIGFSCPSPSANLQTPPTCSDGSTSDTRGICPSTTPTPARLVDKISLTISYYLMLSNSNIVT